ncbi:MAG: DUF4347 domain-containing protein, partial [Gammaproteobacteria bacterium]|nr:DUF4347 domain-containing protein [Gammaproteobacteria bacterium]
MTEPRKLTVAPLSHLWARLTLSCVLALSVVFPAAVNAFELGQRQEIVFVDSALSDREALLRALDLGDSSRDIEVIWLDPSSDGVAQISTALAKRTGIDALHIFSHGEEGGFTIGTTFVDEREARRQATELEGWRASLRPGADLLIYGCRTARGSNGERFLQTLADLTGADVAGSEHLVGSTQSGGEWALGVRAGQIETREAVSAAGREAWPGLLALLGYDSFSYPTGSLDARSGGTGWLDAWAFAGAGSIDVVATGLTHPGGGLVTAGGAVQGNVSGAIPLPGQAVRNLSSSYGAVTETIWVSFLVEPQDMAALSYMGITIGNALADPNTPDITRLFVGYRGTDFNMNSWGHGTDNVVVPGALSGQTAFLVLKLDINEVAGFEVATLYVNPTVGLAAPDVAPSAPKADLDLGTFSTISIGTGHDSFGSNAALVDEIRIGNSYADVASGPPPTATISGTVYTDEGTTNAGAGQTVRLLVNGVSVGNDVTDASGAYSITAAVNPGDAILVYLDQEAIDGTAVTVSDGANLAGLDIYDDYVITRHDNGGALANADMDTALGNYGDPEIHYTVTAGALTVDTLNKLYVPAGHTFAPGADVTADFIKIVGTIDAGANTFSIGQYWDAASGTFNAGTSTVTFVGNAISTFIPGGSTYGSLEINKSSNNRVVTVSSSSLTLAPASSLAITTGIFDLAGNNLDIGAGSSFSNDGILTLQGGETVTNLVNDTDSGSVIYNGGSSYTGLAAGDNYYHLTFENAAGTWTLDNNLDVNSNLNVTDGTLDVSASDYSINVAGDFTKDAEANFVPRSGTVTLDGSNQRISGNPTFFNLVKTVASPDTLTFTAGQTTIVNGTATLQGASGALLSLRSSIPGSSFLFTLGAGATKDISFVDVQDSDASESDAALTPIDPANSVNSGNTVAWFSPTITLSKSADVATAKPGDAITYTLTYGNSSVGDATNLVITDTIPANTTLVPASITGGGTESGGVITWNLGPLAAGQVNRTADFAVTVDAGVLAGVVIDNNATANFDDSGGTPQTPVTSNTANVNVAQAGGVSVQPDQSGNVGSATGNQLSYTFTVTNTGNGNDHFDLGILKSGPDFWIGELYDATGTVLMAQDADADGIWDFVNPAVDFDADGQPDTGTMAAGATLDVILRLTVPAGTTPGDRDVTSLTATSNFDDGFGLATATSVAVSGADTPEISFTKSDTPDPVLSNDKLSYALTYENTGTKIATGVVIVDSIPAGAAYVSSSAFGETGVAIEFSTNNRATWGAEPADPTTVTDIRWIVGNLNKTRDAQVASFDVQPDIALPDGSILVNTATLSSNELPDITVTASTTVRSAVAFTNSTKTVAPTLTSPGATLLYTIFVTNSGAAAGTNVVVTDLLPLETSYVPGSITGAGADDSGAPTLTWNVGVIPAGTTIGPLTYQVIVNNPVAANTFSIQNTASIDSNETLPANTTTATTVLTAAPLFSGSSKTSQDLNAGPLLVGDTIEYRVAVINTGDMNASGVVVTDTVPADTAYVPGSIAGLGADDSAAPNLTWNIGNLAVGVPSVVTFRVTVNGGVPIGTQISNLAQIASDQTAAVSTPPVVNTVGGGTTGSVQSTSPIVPGASVLIRITDADLDTDIATQQSFSETTTNTVTGETELLVYTETGPNTGTFEATVLTVFGVTAGTIDDGVFNVQAGDTLETTYDDVLTSSGAPGSATATT